MKIKSILLTAYTILGLTALTMAQVPSYVPTNGLLGFWPFNGNANDLSGNGNNGIVNGASLSSDRNSMSNAAYSFNGTSNYIEVNLVNAINTTNVNGLTLSGWTNMNLLANQPQSIINTVDNSGNGFMTCYQNTTSKLIGIAGNIGVSPSVNIVSQDIPLINTWYNIVMTCDFNTNTSKLYINSILQSQSSSSLITPILTKIFLGRASTPYWYQNGKLDDIGIWNRALTQQEITNLYRGCNDSIITAEPTNTSVGLGLNTQFTATSASGSTYQWQTNPLNIGWINVPSNTYYTGVITNTLGVNNVSVSNHNQAFRALVNSNGCADTSKVVYLKVADTCLTKVTDTILTTVTDTLIIQTKVGLPTPNIANTLLIYPNPAKIA